MGAHEQQAGQLHARLVATEAEQSVLGALMMDNDAIDRMGDLRAEHFQTGDHRQIFGVIMALVAAGKPADAITVFSVLQQRGAEKDVGGLVYLNQLVASTPSSVNIGRYAGIVRDRAVRRALIGLGRTIVDSVPESTQTVPELIDAFGQRLETLAQERVRAEPVAMQDALTAHVGLMQQRMSGAIKRTGTGLTDLDKRLGGGFGGGELVVVAARPSMGKTAFSLGLAREAAVGNAALFVSLEMPISQLNDRNVAALGHLPMGWVQRPTENHPGDADRWSAYSMAIERAGALNLYIDDAPSQTLLEIRSKARQVKRRAGCLGLIVVDYIGLMGGGDGDNRTQQVGSFSRGLKALAKEMDCPVIALAQLSREVERRPNKRPVMSDLRDSGEIEQDADTILFLYRDEVYNPDSPDKGVAEIIVAKQRQGETGHVGAAFIGAEQRFADLAFDYSRPVAQAPRQPRGLRD